MQLQVANWRRPKAHVNIAKEDATVEDYSDSSSGEEDLTDSDVDILQVNLTIEGQSGSDWYINSGASTHVTGSKRALRDFSPCDGRSAIVMASGARLPILGKGSVITKRNKKIDNVLYVLGLKRNLMSVSKLTDAGNIVVFTSDSCLIVDKNSPHSLILRASRD